MKITVPESMKPYDGEYELDAFSLTLREKRRMKEVSGLAGIEVTNALLLGDQDAALGFAVAAIERKHGRRADVNLLLDAEGGTIILDFSPAEGEDDPLGTGPSSSSSDSERSG
jgi:hypothetical protein